MVWKGKGKRNSRQLAIGCLCWCYQNVDKLCVSVILCGICNNIYNKVAMFYLSVSVHLSVCWYKCCGEYVVCVLIYLWNMCVCECVLFVVLFIYIYWICWLIDLFTHEIASLQIMKNLYTKIKILQSNSCHRLWNQV